MSQRPTILGANGAPIRRQPPPLLVPPSAAPQAPELPPSGLPAISREVLQAQMQGTLYGPGVTMAHAERRIVRENMMVMAFIQVLSDHVDATCHQYQAAGLRRDDAKGLIAASVYALYDMLAAQKALDDGRATLGGSAVPEAPVPASSSPQPPPTTPSLSLKV